MPVLVVAQSSSEIPEGLMNNPVYYVAIDVWDYSYHFEDCWIDRTAFKFPTVHQACADLHPNTAGSQADESLESR